MKIKIRFQCFRCGTVMKFGDLDKRLTYTENRKTEHYNHKCHACGEGRKFIILSIIERD